MVSAETIQPAGIFLCAGYLFERPHFPFRGTFVVQAHALFVPKMEERHKTSHDLEEVL